VDCLGRECLKLADAQVHLQALKKSQSSNLPSLRTMALALNRIKTDVDPVFDRFIYLDSKIMISNNSQKRMKTVCLYGTRKLSRFFKGFMNLATFMGYGISADINATHSMSIPFMATISM
jgi:hypothetical protein